MTGYLSLCLSVSSSLFLSPLSFSFSFSLSLILFCLSCIFSGRKWCQHRQELREKGQEVEGAGFRCPLFTTPHAD